jgi:hypothetical protein
MPKAPLHVKPPAGLFKNLLAENSCNSFQLLLKKQKAKFLQDYLFAKYK